MKTKRKFIRVLVTRHNGTTFRNDLMMSEKHLLITIMNENARIEASVDTATNEEFKRMFGF